MGLPIERWARGAAILDAPPKRILSDIHDLKHYQQQFWRKRMREIKDSGDLIAQQGGFTGMPVNPPAAVTAETASISGTAALWTSSLWTPFRPNEIQAPQAYRIAAWGTCTTAATPANLGFDPRVGAGSTIGSAISGTTLGASTNVALTASITASFWRVEGDITIRAIKAPGANSEVHGYFLYWGTQATASGLAGPAVIGAGHHLAFGGSTASVDLSIASGFSLGVVHTVTTIKYFVNHIHWSAWN